MSSRLRAWLPEIAAFLVGAVLRLALWGRYPVKLGYDFDNHMRYVRYVAEHHALPPIDAFYVAYHPPLFYWIAGALTRHGWTPEGFQRAGILLGIVKLALVWVGLRRFLPESRLARAVALWLVGVVPAGIYLDAMVSNEIPFTLLSTIAILILPLAVTATGRARWLWSTALGLALGLAMLAKVSGLILILVAAGGAAIELLSRRRSMPFSDRRRRALPLGAAVLLSLAVSMPWHARHLSTVHKLFPTTFDTTPWERNMYARVAGTSYLMRRNALYLLGPGEAKLFTEPYWPTDSVPTARFWPQLVATAFGDYLNARWSGVPSPGEPVVQLAFNPMRAASVPYLRASVVGGVLIALCVAVAWLAALVALWRRRDLARGLLLAVPALAIVGQIHFAWQFPFEKSGMVKAHYLMFAAPPLAALFGVACAWLWRRPRWRALAVVELAAIAAVTVYALHTRGLWPG